MQFDGDVDARDLEDGGVAGALSMAKEMHHAAFKWWHLTARAKAREAGIPLPEDGPAWQESIRQAKGRTQ